MGRRRYPTDLSDEKWGLLQPYLPPPRRRGRPRRHDPREVLNAVFHVLKTGCQWRMLPREFPPRKTVFHYFRAWRLNGTRERLNRAIRERLRVRLGRNAQPSAGMVDSQSVKTTGVGGKERGYDGGKKVKGRKRHLLVDTEGFVLRVKVHNAKVMDHEGIKSLLWEADAEFSHLERLWLDAGYRGEGKGKDWVEKVLGWTVEMMVQHPPKPARRRSSWRGPSSGSEGGARVDWRKLLPQRGFLVLPRRWVVERTFAWICHNRRMGKDHERLCSTGEAFVYAATTRLTVRRLAIG